VLRAPYNELIFGSGLYAEIQAILDDPKRRTNHCGSDRAHVQTGRIFCAECGAPLKGAVGRIRRAADTAAYACHKCGRIYRDTGDVDGVLLDDLLYRVNYLKVEAALARASMNGQHHDLPGERQRLKSRYEKLAEDLGKLEQDPDYESDPVKQAKADGKARAMASLTADMGALDRQIRDQNEQIHHDAVVEEAIKLGSALRAEWPNWTPQQRRDLLEAAGWERTNLRAGKRRARYLDPWTMDRHWRKRNGEVEIISGPSPGSQGEARVKTRAELAAEQQGRYICQCGCGRPILLRPHHFNKGASVPGLIRGHNPGGWSTKTKTSSRRSPLSSAEIQARSRARKRGEDVPNLPPGPIR
jgi:hypothetical protein